MTLDEIVEVVRLIRSDKMDAIRSDALAELDRLGLATPKTENPLAWQAVAWRMVWDRVRVQAAPAPDDNRCHKCGGPPEINDGDDGMGPPVCTRCYRRSEGDSPATAPDPVREAAGGMLKLLSRWDRLAGGEGNGLAYETRQLVARLDGPGLVPPPPREPLRDAIRALEAIRKSLPNDGSAEAEATALVSAVDRLRMHETMILARLDAAQPKEPPRGPL